MSGVDIKITDEGFDKAIATIDGIGQLDQGEMLDAIGQLFVQSTRQRIEVTKTSPDGSAWKSNSTGNSILYDSGNLSGSIDYQISGSSVAIGSALIYAAIHQFGGTIKPKKADRLVFMVGNQLVFATKVKIPARPYLGASSQDSEEAIQMIADTIEELFQ